MEDRLKYAEWFIEHGFAVFPVDPQTKKPVIKEWQKYSTTPLSEEEKKTFLTKVKEGYNYAVPGGQKNLVILDVEDKELLKSWIGESELDVLCKKTLCVDTVHGGIHVYLVGDEIPEHKFNPIFMKDGKGVADLQSFNSYVVGAGSCINHKYCESNKCQWRGQDHTTCYSLRELTPIGEVKLKELLKAIANNGKKLGITLSKNAEAWIYGTGESVEDLEELKKELLKYNRFEGKTVEAIRKEVCKSIKKNLEKAESEKAKFTLNTTNAVVCEGKTYADLNLNDRSMADWSVLRVLLNHGVTDVDVLQQLLSNDSKVFAPKSDNYFAVTLKNAWEDVKPYLKIMKDAKGKKAKEIKAELKEALSKRIIEKYHVITFFQRHSSSESIVGIFRWNKSRGIYEPIDETLKTIIRREIKNLQEMSPSMEEDESNAYFEVDTELVQAIYNEVRDLTLTEYDDDTPLRVAFPNYTLEWSKDKNKFIINVYTAEERTEKEYAFHYIPHSIHGEVLTTKPIPIDVQGLEELARRLCPKTLEAFKQWTGDKWITLFEIIGYTLYPATKLKLAFMLLGPRDSGKSTFLQVLKKILGNDNTVSIRIKELFDSNNRFVMGYLFHKLANLTAETKEYSIDDIDRFKTLTGGDQVTSDVKFKGPLTFTPYAKIIVATNKLPNVSDKNDMAFWRRWLIIEFPNQFPNDDTWFHNTFTEEEIQGILTVSILAFVRVFINGQFDYQQTPEEVRDIWLYNIDSVWSFVKTYVEKGIITINRMDADLWVTRKELYGLYKDYCWHNGFPGVSMKIFANKLNKYFGITGMKKNFGTKRDGSKDRRKCFVGIKINRENKRLFETESMNELDQFLEYAKKNNHAKKEFWEIVQDFDDQEKANRFVAWCMKKNMCDQRGVDTWEISLQ